MSSAGGSVSRVGWLTRSAAALLVLGASACAPQDGPEPVAAPAPTTSTPATPAPEVGDTASASTTTTDVESTTSVPEAEVPEAEVVEVLVPTTSVPEAEVPEAEVVEVLVPTTSVPEAEVVEVLVPTTSVPEAEVPEAEVVEVSVPSVSLPVAAEYDVGYDRDDWGPHNSGICRGAAGSPDPYTGTPIDTCNVDHVVALHEAHESGGWTWPGSQKQRFSQDPANHVASRACVNQSKGGDDVFEWSDADIARSSACGGGYTVTPAGRCFLARTTVAVKSEWGLAVDQAEADALVATLAGCGDQAPAFSAEPPATTTTSPPTTTTPPTTTVAPPGECVIAGKTAAQYDAVPGIGEVLSARLVGAQPFTSRADLESVRGIGPVKAEAVWSHFCGS